MTEGKHIVIEGIDGVGKTTQAERLASAIGGRTLGQPGGSPFGAALGELLKDPHLERLDPLTDVFEHAGQRCEFVKFSLEPVIKSGQHFISDRSWHSGFAYQGARGVSTEKIVTLNSIAMGKYFKPDLLIVLTAHPKIARKRQHSHHPADYYEAMNMFMQRRIMSRYVRAAELFGGYLIDANASIEKVGDRILHLVQEKLDI